MMIDFGSDVSFLPDMDVNLSLVTGNTLIGEAIYRRLMTPRGWYPWDPNYGLYIRALLNETLNDQTIARWQREIANEIEKDERILSAGVVLTAVGNAIAINIEVLTALGPFALVLNVSAVSVALLQTSS